MGITYLQLSASSELPEFSSPPFKAVVIAEDSVSPKRRAEISRWLVESGCLYVTVWGTESSAWNDAVNLINLESFGFEKIPDDRLVITTCHERESLSEAFWFSKYSAMHPCAELSDTVLLHLSAAEREQEIRDQYLNA